MDKINGGMIGIYCRVSTEDQSTNTSIPQQLEDGKKFCSSLGLPFKEYTDTFSGASITRTGWIQLFKDIENGLIDGVWVRAIDRFSRNTKDGLTALDILRKKKVKFYIAGIEQDINTAETELKNTFEFAFAQYERSKILKRTLDGRIRTTNAGGRKKQMIFGYNSVYGSDGKRTLVINEEEAKTIQYIFELYTEENLSFKAIATRLNDEGHKTKNYGKKQIDRNTKKETIVHSYWTQTHVSNILKRSEYCGLTYDWNHTTLLEAKHFPVIIDRKVWEPLQPRITLLSVERNRNGIRRSEHELSGLVRCVCGAQYYYRHSQGNLYYYHKADSQAHKDCRRLPKYIPAIQLENAVRAMYMGLMGRTSRLKLMFEQYKLSVAGQATKLQQDRERLELRIKEIDDKIEVLINAIEDGTIKKERIKERMDAYEKELDTFKAQLSDVIGKEKEELGEYEDAMLAYKASTIKEWQDASGSRKREIYYTTFSGITIEDGSIKLQLRIGGTMEGELKVVLALGRRDAIVLHRQGDSGYRVEVVETKFDSEWFVNDPKSQPVANPD